MRDKSTPHAMHLATCLAWALVQIFVPTTVLAQPSNDPEVVVPRTGATQPLPEVTTPTPPPMPRRPQPGDKLGYSKEESTRLLDPEVRQLLDAFLRLYREPGLFTDRRAAMATIGVRHYERRSWRPVDALPGEPLRFVDSLANEGFLGSFGWSGKYRYNGWSGPRGGRWFAALDVNIDNKKYCIDSRAVEGYLDLFLHSGLEGYAHPIPPNGWDRHGAYGSPYATASSARTPNLGMKFIDGCLIGLSVYGAFDKTEVSDENILN